MFRSNSNPDLPTWVAFKEPSEMSADEYSDMEDQIRATPAPQSSAKSHERPTQKRKESDWGSEGTAKRARREQSGDASANPFDTKRVLGKAVLNSSDVANADSSCSTSSSPGIVSNMLPPPLPSRAVKTDGCRLFQTRLQLSKDGCHVPATSLPPPSSAPSHFPSSHTLGSQRKSSDAHAPKRNDIPSSLDSAFFSTISSKKASSSFLVKKLESISADVIEISDNEDYVPPFPSSDKGRAKSSTSLPFGAQKTRNRDKSSATLRKQRSEEVIEITDSDEELPKTMPSRVQLANKESESFPPSTAARTDGPSSSIPHLSDDDDARLDKDFLSKRRASFQSTLSATALSGANKARLSDANKATPFTPVTPPPPSERQMRLMRAIGVTDHEHEQQQESGNIGSSSSPSSSAKKRPNRQGFNSMSVPSVVPTVSPASKFNALSSDSTPTKVAVPNKASASPSSAQSPLRAGRNVRSENSEVYKRSSLVSDDDDSSVKIRDLDTALGIPFSQSPRMKPGSGPRSPSGLPPSRPLVPRLKARKSTQSALQTIAFSDNENGRQDLERLGSSLASAIDLTSDISDEGVDETKISEGGVSSPSPKTSASIGTTPAQSFVKELVLQPPVTLPNDSGKTQSHTRIVRDTPRSLSVLSNVKSTCFEDSQSDNGKPWLSSSKPLSPKVSQIWEKLRDVHLPSNEPQRQSAESSPACRPTTINTRTPSLTRQQSAPRSTGSPIQQALQQSIVPSHSLLRPPTSPTLVVSTEKASSSNPGSPVVSQALTGQESDVSTSSKEVEVALATLQRIDVTSDEEAMCEADEFDVAEDGVSMDERPPASDDGMSFDSDELPLDRLIPSQGTAKLLRVSKMASPDSGMDASSEPGPSRNSSVSVPSTRRSSRISISSYSMSSEDPRLTALDGERVPCLSIATSRSTTPDDANAVAICSKTLGGFPAFRFESYRIHPTNFPKVYYASELPSAIQDHMNRQPEEVKKLCDIREVYEAMILENTADDELDAPPIEIQNDVDDQPTPPWEFWYSNKMWHGKGVPDPDLKNLKGCDCRGACNPKSKTCACALRQGKVVGDNVTEFAYDKNGKLKFAGYPIFECNNMCWCGPECGNRVVQHGRKVRVVIRKTRDKGWGVFNGPKKIPRGTFVGIYAGELLTDKVANARGFKYNKAGITYLFDLDFHHLKDGDEEWTNLYTVDAYHAGNFTRFLNHSCNPNCRLYPCYINEGDHQKPLLVVFSIRDIDPDEEICFNYQGTYPGDDDDDDEIEVHEDDEKPKDNIYKKCLCGAKGCKGVMFR